jgi:hypothetical protein
MFTESTLDFPLQDSRCNEDECGPVEKELRETIARIPVGPIALDRVASSPIRWLWPGRVPLGGLTLLAGDPGVGKSLLTLDLAARVSRGAPWPDELEQESDTQNMALPNPQSAIRNPQLRGLSAFRVGTIIVTTLLFSKNAAPQTHAAICHRPAQRYRDPTHAGHAAGDGQRRGGR